MRLDLFLKWNRIVPRRALAKQVCDAGRAAVNGRVGRASRELHVGDIVAVRLHRKTLTFRVLEVPARTPGKEESRKMIEVLENHRTEDDP